jgi:hypothetical protein
MCQLIIATLLAGMASAQTAVNPADIPTAIKALQSHEGEKNLRCEVEPTKPILNFGLRFQAGYLLEVPLVQYSGAGHTWTITLRITPEGGGEPAYLTDRDSLSNTSRAEFTAQMTGTFLVGEGRYHVDFMVVDDGGRLCRRDWQIAAAPERNERAIKVAMPPSTVADLSYTAADNSTTAAPPIPRRITVLMNSSPPYIPRLRPLFQPNVVVPPSGGPEFADHREALLGILSSLLEKLPGTTVRLVVFDLDQQREVLRQDGFTLKDMEKAAHAADDLEHWVVTVRELQEQPGRWGLLANLIRREINEQEQPDVVLFLGPRAGSQELMPQHFLESEKRTQARFLYLQYGLSREGIDAGMPPEMSNRPPNLSTPQPRYPMTPELVQQDAIDITVARLKGRTLRVYSAVEFVKAIEAIKRR